MTSIVDDLRKWARRAAEVPDHRPLLDGVPELFHLLTDAADRIEYLSEPIRNKKMSKEQISDAITLEIERKLCSFCCDRLYDKPKPSRVQIVSCNISKNLNG